MKTDAINSIIEMREEFESGLTYCAEIGVEARAELTALEAWNAAMRDAIEGAMRIEDLWCPEDEIIRPENANEMKALAAMKAGLEAALSKPTGKVLVSLDDLREIERVDMGVYYESVSLCPVCGKEDAHEDDCWLGNALKAHDV